MLHQLLGAIQRKWHPLWRLRRLPAYRWLQSRLDFTVFIRMQDVPNRVAVKLIRDILWVCRLDALDPEVRRAFSIILEAYRPRVVWDVGANVGYYGWIAAASPYPEKIVMFEPDPDNFALLQATIRRNGLTRCDPRHVALAERSGTGAFLIDRVSGATGTLVAGSRSTEEHSFHDAYGLGETIPCRTTSVDDEIAAGTPAPDLIKIDAEEAEEAVLAGALDTFTRQPPIIIFETYGRSVAERLEALGYAIFTLDATNILALPPSRDPAPIAAHFQRRARTSS